MARPWRCLGSDVQKTPANPLTATLYDVTVTMASGTRYSGQVLTARDERAALDLFYWRVCGLMAGRNVCLEAIEGTIRARLTGVRFKGRESVRILDY